MKEDYERMNEAGSTARIKQKLRSETEIRKTVENRL